MSSSLLTELTNSSVLFGLQKRAAPEISGAAENWFNDTKCQYQWYIAM